MFGGVGPLRGTKGLGPEVGEDELSTSQQFRIYGWVLLGVAIVLGVIAAVARL